ncbi:MAG: hypothetical protein HKN70_08515 [Gammaproteobacteria bacterium]|nr:hypothetical protein [Gammaproteobacteria bacterium]
MKTRINTIIFLIALFMFSNTAHAAFDGDYTLDNWTFQTAGNGTVTPASGDAAMITLKSDDSETGGFTDLFITVVTAGVISFDWFFTNDDLATFETGGYVLNGLRTDLTGGSGTTSVITMTEMVTVASGDVFGFFVESVDGIADPGYLDISEFNGPAQVPVPAAAWLLLSAIAVMMRRHPA